MTTKHKADKAATEPGSAEPTPADPDILSVTLDLTTLTLGEMATIEQESGRSFDALLKGAATRRLLALWVAERRNSARPRSWHELSDLRPFAKRS